MKYTYIPDTYIKNQINEMKIDNDTFIKYQLKYKESFEKLLLKYINFPNIEKFITEFPFSIPVLDDKEYNFYHQSFLNSKYIFLRNNIHIEKLSNHEIMIIEDACLNTRVLNDDFLLNTYQKVLYENDINIFIGASIPSNLVKGKSIIFEFAYDQKKCQTISEIRKIKENVSKLLKLLENKISDKLKTNVSTVIYNVIPDIYKNF